jgi:hypothetical protein
MPPGEGRTRLADEQIATLCTWIDEGLVWDEQLLPTLIPTTDHWAFQSIARPRIPIVKNTSWVRTPLDAFVARQHERLGITPAPLAPKDVLARRLALDISGLPLAANKRSDVSGILQSKQCRCRNCVAKAPCCPPTRKSTGC